MEKNRIKYSKGYRNENLVEINGEIVKEIFNIKESINGNKNIKEMNNVKILLVKRILIIFIILNIQITISKYQNITLKIYKGPNKSIINPSYIDYIQEIYINGEVKTNIISTYNLTKENNLIKLVFNSTLIDCRNMFKNFFNIYEIDFKDFNTSKIEFMHGLFHNCSSLKSIDLLDWDIPKVKNINSLFYNCKF